MNLDDLTVLADQFEKRAIETAAERFIPSSKQSVALSAVLKYPIVLMVGANGIGKSTVAVHEADAWCRGYRPWSGETLGSAPHRVGIFVESFAHASEEDILPLLESVMDPKLIKGRPSKLSSGVVNKWRYKNGSILKIMSYRQKPKDFEGIAWDFVVFNEPPPRWVWIPTVRGLTKGQNKCLFAMTPVDENSAWIFDELYTAADGDPDAPKRSDVFQVTGTKADSFYDPEKLAVMEATLDDDEKEARIYGRFRHLIGRVYKEYDRDVHVLSGEALENAKKLIVDPHVPKGMVVDPHDKRPFAIAWFYVDAEGAIVFFKEWPTDLHSDWKTCTYGPQDYVTHIQAEEEKEGIKPVIWRLMDPNFGRSRKITSTETLEDQMCRFGLPFDTRIDDSIPDGHLAVKDLLRYDRTKPIVAGMNQPHFYCTPNCINIDWSFEHYCWMESRRSDGRGVREKPGEIGKDFMDVVRYAALFHPGYFDPETLNRPQRVALTDPHADEEDES